MSGRLAIAVDLGGTNIHAALVDRDGRIVAADKQRTPVAGGPDAVLGRIASIADHLRAHAREIGAEVLGVGLGIPGLVDAPAGRSVFSPNLFWRDVPVLEPIAAALRLPVRMDNDVRCATLGEFHFGAGRGLENFVCITLGTGIGSGIVVGGRLYRGSHQSAGEIGHVRVVPDGPPCNCGRTGCLEAVASATAVARMAGDRLAAGAGGLLPEYAAAGASSGSALDAALVARAALAGDAVAREILAEAGTYLGMAIATYADLVDPSVFIVGGGLSLAGELVLEPARRASARHAMPGIAERIRIAPAVTGDSAGMLGAAALVPGLLEAAG